MEKQREEALKWFVQFANMDLEEIKPGDKAKLLVESEEYLFPNKEVEEFKRIITKGIPAHIAQEMMSGNSMTLLKSSLGKVGWAFDKDSPEHWTKILQLQSPVKRVLQLISEFHLHDGSSEALPWTTTVTGVFQWGHGKQPFTLNYLPITGTQDDYIELKLFRFLDGLPSHAIRLCPGCEKYFFNPSLRDKNFCSPRCMWRINTEQRRKDLKEKHPQKYKAYLKKQKEIMRQKYEKKQKAKGYRKIGPYKRKD